MALTNELLHVLDDKEEPIAKRLKIANNAFVSTELLIHHREAILFKWILKNSKNSDAWQVIQSWVDSVQFREINRTELTNDDITSIINGITKSLKHVNALDEQTRTLIFNCISLLLDNRIFLQYFKYNTASYCTFICNILHKIDHPNDLLQFIKCDSLFHKNIIGDEAFTKQFLEINLPEFIAILKKFNSDKLVFIEVSKIIQKCIFNKNSKKFDDFFAKLFEKSDNTEKLTNVSLPKAVFKLIIASYHNLELTDAVLTYQIIFHAFCINCNQKTELIYEFLIVLSLTLGFDVSKEFNLNKITKLLNSSATLKKSIEILSGLLEILSELNTIQTTAVVINNITLTSFIQNLIKTVLILTKKPDGFCYDIIINSIKINPLVIEPIVNEVVIYIILSKNGYKEKYELLLIKIFEVFAKLNRIQNLITKIIPDLRSALEGEKENGQPRYEFRGTLDFETHEIESECDVLPEGVLDCFENCVSSLASWLGVSLFKKLTLHMRDAVDNLATVKNEEKFTHLEVLASLIASFLKSARIAEHTVPLSLVGSFVKNLDELKDVLAKFGCAVLHKEHNHTLMKAFLTVSYAWGEMYIILAYYSHSEKVTLPELLDSDCSACNVTYLHSYLSVQKWCLIYERIKNFGERPCKILMQKLFVQKIRALSLFHKQTKKEMFSIIAPITSIISLNLEENWRFILSDKYIINHLIKHMDTQSLVSLTELLIDDAVINKNKKFNHFDQLDVLENGLIVKGCIFALLAKINKQFRKKRGDVAKPLSSLIFSKINQEKLLNDQLDFAGLDEDFGSNLLLDAVLELKLNEEELLNYLNVLTKLPVVFASEKAQKIVLIYLFALHRDVSLVSDCAKTKQFTEAILVSLLELTKIPLAEAFNIEIIMQYLTKFVERSAEIFTVFTENVFKKERSLVGFEKCVAAVSENIKNHKFLEFGLIILNSCNKLKKLKMAAEVKDKSNEYKQLICKKIVKLLTKKNSDANYIEAYATMLKMFLAKDEDNSLATISPLFEQYLELALTLNNANCKGLLELFTIVLQNKSQLNVIKENTVLQIWNAVKTFNIEAINLEEYSRLITLIFEHIPNEQFLNITQELLDYTVLSSSEADFLQFKKYLTIWTSILSCRFNPNKTKIWQNVLESLLLKVLQIFKETSYSEDTFTNTIDFVVALIQTSLLPMTPLMIDTSFLIVTELISKDCLINCNYVPFNSSVSVLESLLKYRNALLMDRLPPFLQEYQLLLKELTLSSDSNLKLSSSDVQMVADCAHKFEKFTNNLVKCNRHMVRMAPYLIADILKQYEEVTLYPNVRIHLNNCIYSLMSLCDHHGILYLKRVLSSASTEIFKNMYDHYGKYYKFTGKI